MQDVVERIWDFIDDFNINSVLKFLKDNIVGTVVVVSLIFWVPISCLISYVDNKRAKKVTFYVKSILVNLNLLWRIYFQFFRMKKNGNGELETSLSIRQIAAGSFTSEYHDDQVVKMDILLVKMLMPEEPPDWSEPRQLNQHFDDHFFVL